MKKYINFFLILILTVCCAVCPAVVIKVSADNKSVVTAPFVSANDVHEKICEVYAGDSFYDYIELVNLKNENSVYISASLDISAFSKTNMEFLTSLNTDQTDEMITSLKNTLSTLSFYATDETKAAFAKLTDSGYAVAVNLDSYSDYGFPIKFTISIPVSDVNTEAKYFAYEYRSGAEQCNKIGEAYFTENENGIYLNYTATSCTNIIISSEDIDIPYPTQSSTSTVPCKKSSSSWWIYVTVAVVIIAVLAVLYYFAVFKRKQKLLEKKRLKKKKASK